MSPELTAVAVGGQVLGGVMGAKGAKAASSAAQQAANYNAQVAENEAVLLQRAKTEEETALRRQSSRLIATQRVATAASGIQMSGSPMQALADSYFNTEKDAARIQYASSIEQIQKESQANIARFEGASQSAALEYQAQQSLLSGFTGGAQTYGNLS